ncbi:MAG: bifunctional oligoribonuclease/PAP phosphatase NrnA [Anaerolineae bacterium]
MNTLDWQAATDAVHAAQTILVVTHMNPDGDAFGSLLGLTNALRGLGKTVNCAVDDGLTSESMMFLPGSNTVLEKLNKGTWDLMISVDASDEERTGKVGAYGRANSAKVINLDHHPTNTLFGHIHLIDPAAVSASEIIFRWLKTMDYPFSTDVVVPLLTGLVTDTIGFRTNNVTAATLGLAQEMMQYGASLTEITERTLDNRPYQVVNLWKEALSSVALYEHNVIAATITLDDIKKAGMHEMTDGGLVNFLIKVNEASIAVVFKATEEGEVSVSIRAKPGFNVADVAFSLGGGGHILAAGATIPGPVEEARKRVIPLLQEAAKRGKLVIA